MLCIWKNWATVHVLCVNMCVHGYATAQEKCYASWPTFRGSTRSHCLGNSTRLALTHTHKHRMSFCLWVHLCFFLSWLPPFTSPLPVKYILSQCFLFNPLTGSKKHAHSGEGSRSATRPQLCAVNVTMQREKRSFGEREEKKGAGGRGVLFGHTAKKTC